VSARVVILRQKSVLNRTQRSAEPARPSNGCGCGRAVPRRLLRDSDWSCGGQVACRLSNVEQGGSRFTLNDAILVDQTDDVGSSSIVVPCKLQTS
jgi:hypothetical protein